MASDLSKFCITGHSHFFVMCKETYLSWLNNYYKYCMDICILSLLLEGRSGFVYSEEIVILRYYLDGKA